MESFTDNSVAKGIMKAPFITVNSWNEWTETSYLQQDDLYGYGYLEAIKEVFNDEGDKICLIFSDLYSKCLLRLP